MSNVADVEPKEYQVRYNITSIVGDSSPDPTAGGWEIFATHRRSGASKLLLPHTIKFIRSMLHVYNVA